MSGSASDLVIESVSDAAGCREVEELQAGIWAFSPEDVVPDHQLMTAARYGGHVLVARRGGRPVGFCYGFVGLRRGQPILCSHMLGIVPEERSQGVGFALKQAQREHARRHGIGHIVWTYDPLESRNAHFNLHRLGARAVTYLEDLYGPMRDALNRGMPSDRLVVDWTVEDAVSASPPPGVAEDRWVNPAASSDAPPSTWRADLNAAAQGPDGPLFVAIPADIQALKARDLGAAVAWRLHTRAVFQAYFQSGWQAVDYLRPGTLNTRPDLGFYALARTGTDR